LRGQRPVAIALGLLSLLEVLLLTRGTWVTGASSVSGQLESPDQTNVQVLSSSLFTRYLLAFEATSVLLLIAVVGAVVLARRPSRSEMSVEEQTDANVVSQ
jgi:NADH-quinone oxidoreductase subunit J